MISLLKYFECCGADPGNTIGAGNPGTFNDVISEPIQDFLDIHPKAKKEKIKKKKMKSLVESIVDRLEESIIDRLEESIIDESVDTYVWNVKNGKNFWSNEDIKAKNIKITGDGSEIEVIIDRDSTVVSIDLSDVHATNLLRIVAEQNNKLESIVCGENEAIECRIRKNVHLKKLDLSKGKYFGGRVTYIDKNKNLKLDYKDLPKYVNSERVGLIIDAGKVKLTWASGIPDINKEIKEFSS